MCNSRQENPQKPVFPFGRDPSLIVTGWNLHLALELAVVDFHCDNVHRLTRRGHRHLLLLQGLRRFAVTSNQDPAQFNVNFDLIGFNARQFYADSKTRSALENVDRRTPLNASFMKIREMDLRDLVGNFANLALKKTKANRAVFLAHNNSQWTRRPNEATAKPALVTNPGTARQGEA
jgi:hypothetical protein